MDASFLLTAAEKVIVPMATALIGVAVTLWKMQQKRKDDFAALKATVEGLIAKRVDDRTAFANLIQQIQEGLKKDFDSLGSSMTEKAAQVRQVNRSFAKIVERYTALETQVEAAREAITRIDTEHTEYNREQSKLWQSMSQQIGQVDGYLRAMNRRASGDYHSPTQKR